MRLFIIAEQDAFNFLKENGNLPAYVSVWRDGTKQKGELSVGISQDDWDTNGAALSDVFSEQGNFTWRTHFNVGISKSIEIEVTDYRKNIIYVGRDPARVMITFSN